MRRADFLGTNPFDCDRPASLPCLSRESISNGHGNKEEVEFSPPLSSEHDVIL